MTAPEEPEIPRAAAVVVAAGDSQRMGGAERWGVRKPLIELDGQPLVAHTMNALHAARTIVEVVLVAHADDVRRLEKMCADRPEFEKVVAVVPGGATRSESVGRGVFWTSFEVDVVCVHDAARPLVSPTLIDLAVSRAHETGGAVVAVPASDTVKVSRDGHSVVETLDRSTLWNAQTPQCFRAREFRALVARAHGEEFLPTDDAALWERYVGPVTIVEGDAANLKVTRPLDVTIAELLLSRRETLPASEAT